MSKRVLVLAQYAVIKGSAGGTRHVELFSRLTGWTSQVVAADWTISAGRTREKVVFGNTSFDPAFTSPYRANNMGRVFNWLTYALSASVKGIVGPRPSIVYASSPPLFVGLAGFVIAKLRRVPLVFEVRDLWPLVFAEMGAVKTESTTYRMLATLERFLYRHAAAIVVLARGSTAHIERCGVSPSKIHFIPNGAEPADFDVEPGSEMDLGFEGFTVTYAGAHGPANGLHLVLDAAAAVQSDFPQIQFLLVGGGVEKPSLIEQCQERSLNNVHFMDYVPKSSIPGLLAASDVGLHVLADVPLFRYAVSPNKLFDYMAAGLPVVTNTPGEVAEMVQEAEAGLAVGPTEIAEGVTGMYRAGDKARAIWGNNGRRFIEIHHSRSILSERLQSLLDALLEA